MNHLQHNRQAWNKRAADGDVWSTPVDAQTIARARAGDWQIDCADAQEAGAARLVRRRGGPLRAGLVLTGLYEDHSQDATWVFSKHSPVAVATRALKPR